MVDGVMVEDDKTFEASSERDGLRREFEMRSGLGKDGVEAGYFVHRNFKEDTRSEPLREPWPITRADDEDWPL